MTKLKECANVFGIMRQLGSGEIRAIANFLANRDGIDDLEHHPRFEEYWEEAEELAKARNLKGYLECSSKTGENVDSVIEMITKAMLDSL